MDDRRFGTAIRAVRLRRQMTQAELGRAAGMSDSVVSRIERGEIAGITVGTIRRMAAVLDVRFEPLARWRGGDLDRLLNARHSALHNEVAGWLARRKRDWVLAPETSFSIYGERGVIDLLAYRPESRALLVVELKTEIVDVNELLGTLDRKRRLAPKIAKDRDWPVESVATVLVVSATRTNQRRLTAHADVIRAALPADGRTIRAWLRDPRGRCDGVLLWRTMTGLASVRRVRSRKGAAAATMGLSTG